MTKPKKFLIKDIRKIKNFSGIKAKGHPKSNRGLKSFIEKNETKKRKVSSES